MSGGRYPNSSFSSRPLRLLALTRASASVTLTAILALAAADYAVAQNASGLRPSISPTDPYAEIEPAATPDDTERVLPNYGRRRPLPDKRKAYTGCRKQAPRALPPLQPYPSAPRQVRVRSEDAQPPVQYAIPGQIPRKQRPRVEDNPYAPLGIDMGSIRVLPFIEFSGGYDTNSGLSGASPRGSSLTRIDAGFTAFSLWSRHEFRADVRGGYF